MLCSLHAHRVNSTTLAADSVHHVARTAPAAQVQLSALNAFLQISRLQAVCALALQTRLISTRRTA